MKKIVFLMSIVLLFSFYLLPASAEESSGLPNADVIIEPSTDSPVGPDTYGTADGISKWIGASEFETRNSGQTYQEYGYGYIYRTGGSSADFTAQFSLPNGADLQGFRLYYCDTDASNNIQFWLTRYYGDTSPDYTDDTYWVSSGTPGCTTQWVITPTVPYTIDNYSNTYNFIIRMTGATTSALRFKGVRAWYTLQISPAPGTATFSDVPTSHDYFQHIEALVASGITVGCGGGKYCPGSYLTRGQMAVFLSKALGLHWPD